MEVHNKMHQIADDYCVIFPSVKLFNPGLRRAEIPYHFTQATCLMHGPQKNVRATAGHGWWFSWPNGDFDKHGREGVRVVTQEKGDEPATALQGSAVLWMKTHEFGRKNHPYAFEIQNLRLAVVWHHGFARSENWVCAWLSCGTCWQNSETTPGAA